jgi:hypothetical protein
MPRKTERAADGAASTARGGRTEKISVSLERSDLQALRRRAKRLYGGNVSAAIAEAARRIREEEGRDKLVVWLGDSAKTTAQERDAIRTEWSGASEGSGSRRKR